MPCLMDSAWPEFAVHSPFEAQDEQEWLCYWSGGRRAEDDFGDAEGAQAREGDLEQRAAGDFHERLGAIVGERAQARAEAGGEDHGFHTGAFIKPARLRRRP